jgi:hypothetical protein
MSPFVPHVIDMCYDELVLLTREWTKIWVRRGINGGYSLDGRRWRHIGIDGIDNHRVAALEGPCDVYVACA